MKPMGTQQECLNTRVPDAHSRLGPIETKKFYSIHRPTPTFTEMSTNVPLDTICYALSLFHAVARRHVGLN